MKALLLLLAVSAAPSNLSHYEQLLAKSQFSELEHQLIQQQDYKQQDGLLVIYAKALISQQRLEDANTLLNYAIEQFPNNSELNYLAGLSKIRLASDGNVFAAKERAARGVALLQQAVTLKPDHFAARQALIDFYSIAPAAAGGDKAQAAAMAQQLAQGDKGIHLMPGAETPAMPEFDETLIIPPTFDEYLQKKQAQDKEAATPAQQPAEQGNN